MLKGDMSVRESLTDLQEQINIKHETLEKVYGIQKGMSYGSKDTWTVGVISPIDAYGCGGLPPVFTTRELAEQFIKETTCYSTLTVVELDLK